MLGYQRVSNISIVLISSSIAAKISLSFSLLLRRILYRCWAIWLTPRKTLDDNNMQPRTPNRNTVVALSGDLNINQNQENYVYIYMCIVYTYTYGKCPALQVQFHLYIYVE